jgi:hypothetical protein
MARNVEGERLDVVLERLRQPGEVDQTALPEAFSAILGAAGADDRATHGRSLETDLIDFTIPRISEPGIFHASRSISLLEHFLNDLLPTLDESEELRTLAAKVIGDEISRQRDILERLQAGIAA